MSDERSIPAEGRYRLRLSIRPRAYHLLENVADSLDMELTTVATLAFSLGLRALASVSSTSPAVGQLVEQHAEAEFNAAFEDADVTPPDKGS